MKICKTCGVEKEAGEFYCDKRSADKLRGDCKKCSATAASAWARSRLVESREYAAKWRSTHRDAACKASEKWRASNPEKVRASAAAWREKNAAKRRVSVSKWKKDNAAVNAQHTANWKRLNPAKVNACNSKRRAAEIKATPAWADQRLIQFKYNLAARMTKATGYQWDVDHVVPLKHPLVCGLHVENNLQVITHAKNISKGNRVQL